MKTRSLIAAAFPLLVPLSALAQSAFTALHPERQYPDPPAQSSPHAYSELIIRVQKALRTQGFDAGPPNGDFGAKTQAALAQFQLSRVIPASGALDDQTLAELGVERDRREAAAGSSAAPKPDSPAKPPDASSPEKKPGGAS
jgi:peptidoglycan hydrolase-like protein with peptidoglycan-binding domain